MKMDSAELQPAITRLKRARGQLDAVIRMMEEGKDCQDIVMQLSAASKAVDRAGYLVIANGMKRCFLDESGEALDEKTIEKMFISLA